MFSRMRSPPSRCLLVISTTATFAGRSLSSVTNGLVILCISFVRYVVISFVISFISFHISFSVMSFMVGSVALLVARQTNDRKVAVRGLLK